MINKKDLPNCTESGDWDGQRSDWVLVFDSDGVPNVGRCYSGFMDGSDFFDWFDRNDFELKDVISWANIPDVVDVGYYDLADKNAKLLETNKELLEALETLIEETEDFNPVDNEHELYIARLAAEQAVQQAIKNAEG